MDNMDRETSSKPSGYGQRTVPLLKIQDMSDVRVPEHVEYLMNMKGDQDFISIHEVAARLCHVMMVETGFFPFCDELAELTAESAMDMFDFERISKFGKELSTSCIFSEQGIYSVKYKAILFEMDEFFDKGENEKDKEVLKFSFSNDVQVTMLILGDRLHLTATFQKGENPTIISHQLTLNIEEFFIQRPRVLPVKLRPDQWIRKYSINYARLSVYFKSKFCLCVMDLLDGTLFEKRGLYSLSELAIHKILKMSDVKTILSMGKTCTYFYNIVRSNNLWKFLLSRDFRSEPMVPPPIPPPLLPGPLLPTFSAELNSIVPQTLKTNGEASSEEPDYYEIYKQKYTSKHNTFNRRLHRLNSFPIRFAPFRIARRFPSIPFNYDRF